MKSLILIMGWLALCVLAAAILAPWVYLGLHQLGEHVSWIQPLADYKFHRYFNRLVTIFALLGIIPVGRALGYRTLGSLGLGGTHRAGRFALGFISSALFLGGFALSLFLLGFSAADARIDAGFLLKAILSSLTIGLIVGLLEELFFRGFVFDSARREIGAGAAVALVSFFYSIVHFVKSPGAQEIKSVAWDSAFRMLPLYFSGMHDIPHFVFGFCTLFLAGWILAWAYLRTGNLYLSIGLHAGWVFALKLNGRLTDWTPMLSKQAEWFLGFGGDLVSASLALVVLALQWRAIQALAKRLIVLGP